MTAKQQLAARALSRVQDYKRVFNTQQGKRVLHDMMESHYVMRNTYEGKEDPYGQAFREGQRHVVLRIFSIMETNPSQMEDILREANDVKNT